MTVQTAGGMQGTYDGTSTVPGDLTRTSMYASVRKFLMQQMGTEKLVVLFFALEPDQL
ncbi:hypothetical protein ACWCZ5_12255 [Streptomyces sp. NPDC001667]